MVRVVISSLASFHRLYKHGGTRFLVIYLKACSSMLQQAMGGQRLYDLTPFGARVRRTNGGLPRIIPVLHRNAIRANDRWTIRFWATLFGLYRILEFPGKVKLSTVTNPFILDPFCVYEFSQFVRNHLVPTLKGKFPSEGTILEALWPEEGDGPLEFMKSLRARPFIIPKSGPSIRGYNVPASAQASSPASILASAWTWRLSPLYPVLQNWCKMTGNVWVLNRIESWAQSLWVWEDSHALSSKGPLCPFKATNWLGKIGFKPEPAGKIRVFAIVDPWTQWLMDALHQRIFKLLALIPQDGTFNQLKPIENLLQWQRRQAKLDLSLGPNAVNLHPAKQDPGKGQKLRLAPLFSFDLSAATDRLPITLQKVLLSPFITAWGAELWSTLLVGREYSCPRTVKFGKGPEQVLIPKGQPAFVKYAVGQPMGALSSWAMLALFHHALVQWAAFRAGVITTGTWYEGYAILGDDVVIAGAAVAREYRRLCGILGVEIGDHKSLVSNNGVALEFAKRTFLNGMDVSMVPFSEFVMGRQSLAGLLELVRKYSLTLGQTLSVLGYGYKAKAAASKPLFRQPKRLRNYLLAFLGPGSSRYIGLKGWLTMKSVTSSYKTHVTRVRGLVEHFFLNEVKLIRELLDSFAPLVARAKELGTVHRDREHYGTAPRGADRQSLHLGIERTTPHEVVDSLNETVYREAFLDSVIKVRDLRTRLDELEISSLDWEGMESLWATTREIETELASLPFPRNIDVRTAEKSKATDGMFIKRWYRNSGVFRATVDPSGPGSK